MGVFTLKQRVLGRPGLGGVGLRSLGWGLPTLSWGATGRAGDKGLRWLLGRDRAPSLDLPPRQPL